MTNEQLVQHLAYLALARSSCHVLPEKHDSVWLACWQISKPLQLRHWKTVFFSPFPIGFIGAILATWDLGTPIMLVCGSNYTLVNSHSSAGPTVDVISQETWEFPASYVSLPEELLWYLKQIFVFDLTPTQQQWSVKVYVYMDLPTNNVIILAVTSILGGGINPTSDIETKSFGLLFAPVLPNFRELTDILVLICIYWSLGDREIGW